MSDETTTEKLAEIEGQPQPIQVCEGRWRTRGGDIRNVRPTPEGDEREERWPWLDAEYGQTWGHDGRYFFSGGDSPLDLDTYLGPIEPAKTQELPAYTPPEGWQSVPLGQVLNEIYIRPIEIEPEPEPEPIQVREGRWKTRNGEVKDVKPIPTGHMLADSYPWWDGRNTWRNDGRFDACDEHPLDLDTYLGPIETEPQPEPADTADKLRSEVSYVQRLLGESRQRVTHLDALVTSLRTINTAQEQAVERANKANDDLQNRLKAVAAEWAQQAETSRRLQIELDAAQQVPADSPDLRQLQLRLADMTLDRDQWKDAWNQMFTDLQTIRETTKAESVEAIVEWLQHFRGCNSPALALLLLEALPHIMRSLTGLNTEDVD